MSFEGERGLRVCCVGVLRPTGWLQVWKETVTWLSSPFEAHCAAPPHYCLMTPPALALLCLHVSMWPFPYVSMFVCCVLRH